MNERKGGAARLREKNKTQLLSLASSNMKVDTLFKMQSGKVSYLVYTQFSTTPLD